MISLLLAAIMLVSALLVFTSCKKEITCAMCGKTKTTTPHDITLLGRDVTICDECYEDYKKLQDGVDELLGK